MYRGSNRLLLVFAPSPDDEDYTRQSMLLRGHEDAMEDRDLLMIDLFEEDPDGSAARRKFGVERGTFTAVLVGKDGGAKFRSGEPVRPQDLFGHIDAMPMRRREMQDRGQGGP